MANGKPGRPRTRPDILVGGEYLHPGQASRSVRRVLAILNDEDGRPAKVKYLFIEGPREGTEGLVNFPSFYAWALERVDED